MQRKWQRHWKKRILPQIMQPVMVGMLLFSSYSIGLANPTEGIVTAGSAMITTNGSTLTVNQTTSKASINWNSFGIATGETVRFIQPSAASIALNRVVGSDASAIYGNLSANGRVFLVNPNGILFAPGSQVNVGGLVASTLDVSNTDFINGNYSFGKKGNAGSVVNQGTIQTGDGGYVAFLGPQVKNEGVIAAQVTGLAAGDKINLDFNGDKLLGLTVDAGALGGNVSNSGTIKADGGMVVMSTGTKDALLNTVVNNNGVILARSVNSMNGVIRLEGGAVTNSGKLDASGKASGQTGGIVQVVGDTVTLASASSIDVSGDAGGGTALIGGAYQGGANEYAATNTTVAAGATINANAITSGNGGQVVVWSNDTTNFAGSITAQGGSISGNGGSVETSGKKTLNLAGKVDVSATNGRGGSWLLDPTYSNIDATAAQSIVDALTAGATVTDLATDITISSPIIWTTSNSTLILDAGGTLSINATISAGGAGSGLKLSSLSGTYTLASGKSITLSGSGATFSLKKSSDPSYTDYTVINSNTSGGALAALQNIGADNTTLVRKYFLGVDVDASSTSSWNSGAGFRSIGSDSSFFTGIFDAGGHSISNLTINRPGENYVGLIGYNAGILRNINLVGSNVIGGNYVGGLAGYSNSGGIIGNVASSGSVTSAGVSGNKISLTGSADGIFVGGLVGYNLGNISSSSTSGTVNSDDAYVENTSAAAFTASYTGGLVGNNAGAINDSHSSANVTATASVSVDKYYIGGLLGYNGAADITSSYASGDVSGVSGGGSNGKNRYIGGLIGYNQSGTISGSDYRNGTIFNAQSTITGSSNYLGGLVGWNEAAAISDSHSSGVSITQSGTDSSYIGGLVGYNRDGSIDGSTSSLAVHVGVSTGGVTVGGLVGDNETLSGRALISHSSSTGAVLVDGGYSVTAGGLVGQSNGTSTVLFAAITDSFSTGSVSVSGSSTFIGGLVGNNSSIYSSITNSYHSLGTVTDNSGLNSNGSSSVGGLVGQNAGSIGKSYNDGQIISNSGNYYSYVGGLVGSNAGAIEKSYNTGQVTGNSGHYYNSIGGFVGYNSSVIPGTFATITESYNLGNVNSASASDGTYDSYNYVGGLVGHNSATGKLQNTYNQASVTNIGASKSNNFVGGLAGYNNATSTQMGSIANSYSAGHVAGTVNSPYYSNNVGGFVGKNKGMVVRSFWDTDVSGTGIGIYTNLVTADLTGLTTAQMKNFSSYYDVANPTGTNNWSIAASGGSPSVWRIYAGSTYPLLHSFLTPLTITVSGNNPISEYNGASYTSTGSATYSISGAPLSGAVSYGGMVNGVYASNSGNAGTYTLGGLYSNQQGYDITYAGATTLTITQAPLTIMANNASKIAGAPNPSFGAIYSGFVSGDTSASLTGTLQYNIETTQNGAYKITPYGQTSGNYAIDYRSGVLTITQPSSSVAVSSDGMLGTVLAASGITSSGGLFGGVGLAPATGSSFFGGGGAGPGGGSAANGPTGGIAGSGALGSPLSIPMTAPLPGLYLTVLGTGINLGGI